MSCDLKAASIDIPYVSFEALSNGAANIHASHFDVVGTSGREHIHVF